MVSLAGGIAADAEAFAREHGIGHVSTDLEECLDRPGVEAAVITSPNQLHCEQAVAALERGLHVLLELPMGLSLAESRRVVEAEERSGKVAMMCHTQRYNAAEFRRVHRMIEAGDLHLHHIVQQTYFFRRVNENRFGRPRIWTDDLLWHQACHMIDMVYWLLGDPGMEAWGRCGPVHESLQVPMDICISLRSAAGCLVSAAPVVQQPRSDTGGVAVHRRGGDVRNRRRRAARSPGERTAPAGGALRSRGPGRGVLRRRPRGAQGADQLLRGAAGDGDNRPRAEGDGREGRGSERRHGAVPLTAGETLSLPL